MTGKTSRGRREDLPRGPIAPIVGASEFSPLKQAASATGPRYIERYAPSAVRSSPDVTRLAMPSISRRVSRRPTFSESPLELADQIGNLRVQLEFLLVSSSSSLSAPKKTNGFLGLAEGVSYVFAGASAAFVIALRRICQGRSW